MIDRRSFIIQGSTLFATVPTLAALLPAALAVQTPLMTGAGADQNPIQFKIDGWDHFDSEASNGNDLWLRIDLSWRSAWR